MFVVDGKMCVSAGDDEIMCRIDPVLHDSAIAKNGCRSVIMRGREYKGYVYVKEETIKRKKNLDDWLNLCLDFNKRAKAAKKKKK